MKLEEQVTNLYNWATGLGWKTTPPKIKPTLEAQRKTRAALDAVNKARTIEAASMAAALTKLDERRHKTFAAVVTDSNEYARLSAENMAASVRHDRERSELERRLIEGSSALIDTLLAEIEAARSQAFEAFRADQRMGSDEVDEALMGLHALGGEVSGWRLTPMDDAAMRTRFDSRLDAEMKAISHALKNSPPVLRPEVRLPYAVRTSW